MKKKVYQLKVELKFRSIVESVEFGVEADTQKWIICANKRFFVRLESFSVHRTQAKRGLQAAASESTFINF